MDIKPKVPSAPVGAVGQEDSCGGAGDGSGGGEYIVVGFDVSVGDVCDCCNVICNQQKQFYGPTLNDARFEVPFGKGSFRPSGLYTLML